MSTWKAIQDLIVHGAIKGMGIAMRDALAREWEIEENVVIRKLRVGKGWSYCVLRPNTTPETRLSIDLKFELIGPSDFDARTLLASFDDALELYAKHCAAKFPRKERA